MAVQTIYILGTTAVTPNFFGNTQLNGSAPTAATSVYGWTPAKISTATPSFQARLGASATVTTAQAASWIDSTSGPTKGTGSTNTTAGDSFIAGPFTGTFAATAWTFNWNMRAGVAGANGRLRMRVWKSANAAGTSATALTSSTQQGSTVVLSTTADTNSSMSWSPGAITLSNEYLFFQLEWQEQVAGSSNSDTVFFRTGTSSIVTPDLSTVTQWQGTATLAGAGGLTADITRVPAGGAVPASLVLSNNVLHYTFDAITTGTVADSSAIPVTSLLHFDGTAGSQTITDSTGLHTWTATGTAVNAQLSTAQKKFGSSSVLFTDNNSSISGDGTINFGTKDFTIDFWIYRNGSQGQNNWVNITDTGHVIYMAASGGVVRFYMGGDAILGSTAVTDNAWHHIALTRNALTFYLFLDGVLQGTFFSSADLGTAGAGFPQINYPGFGLVGYLDEFRIQLGIAEFTSNFTPTSSAYAANGANNNTGNVAGSGTTSVSGQIGNALSFNGSGYVTFTSVSLLKLATQISELSVCCWIKTTGTDCTILGLRSSGNSNTLFDFVTGFNGVTNLNTGKPSVIIRGDAGTYTTIDATTAVNDNAWHHVAFTRNSSQLVTLYIDGVSNASATDVVSSALTPDLTDSAIGVELFAGGRFFTGLMDDFQVYNRALTSTEVNSIYSYTTTPAQTYQITAPLAGAGTASWPTIDPIDQLMRWSAVLAGSGNASWPTVDPIDQLLRVSSNLNGAGTLAADARRWITEYGPILASAVGSLTAQAGIRSLITSAFAGAGTANWPTVDPIDQLLVAKVTLAGAGSQSLSALSVLLGTTSALSGAGAASWPTIDPIDQLLIASSALAGSSSLAGDVTRVVAAGIVYQAVLDPWVGASTLAAQAAARLPAFSNMAGAAALAAQATLGLVAKATAFSGAGAASWLTVDPIDQLLAASTALAGASAVASSLLTLRPVAAVLSGAGTQLSGFTARMPSAAALAGAGTLASSLSQALLSSAIWAGTGSSLSSLAQQLSVGTAPLTGAGTLIGDAPVLRAASAVFAGSSALNAVSAQWLTSSAVAAGAGSLIAAPAQWQCVAALASGASTLGSDVFVPGHNNWSAVLQVWPATGSLTAATTARLGAGPAPWAAASSLAGALTARAPISAAAAGVGQLASVISSLQLVTNASWSGAGALAANYRQLLTITGSVLTGLVGGLATTPAQWMSATSALSGVGAIVGDIVKLTGGQLQPIDAVVYPGLSALTAQTTQLLQGLTAWSGAGALSPPTASVIEPVTLSPAGLGSMAASAAMRMSAVFAAVGAGSLTGDVQRFTPGVQQGTALLAGASLLVAASSQSMAATLALAGQGTTTARLAQGMGAGAFWSGASALLSAEGLRLQARSLLAGSGLLQVDVLTPRGLAALFAATSSLQASSRLLGSLVATQAGASSLAARTTGALATQSLLSSTGQLTARLTAFEQIAGTLAAAGYSAAYLGEIQFLSQQMFGAGVLGANLVQTSIRVVTATVIGRPSESGIIGRKLTAATVTGQDPRAGIIGRKPTATAMTGQDPRAGVIGQGDFVTLH